jgi:K+-transporting ATPase KdpF subunit
LENQSFSHGTPGIALANVGNNQGSQPFKLSEQFEGDNMETIIVSAIALALFVYLFFVMIRPDKF